MEKIEEKETTAPTKECFADFRKGLLELENMVRRMIQRDPQEVLECNNLVPLDCNDDLNKTIKKQNDTKEEKEQEHVQVQKEEKTLGRKVKSNGHINEMFKRYEFYPRTNNKEKGVWKGFGYWTEICGGGGEGGREGGEWVHLLGLGRKRKKRKGKTRLNGRKFKFKEND